MSSPLHHLEVVSLFGSDVSEPRPAAHDVDDDAGELGAGQVGDAFLHQAYSRARGRGQHANTGRGCAVCHLDGGDLAFRLEEDSSDLRHHIGCSLGDLAGRSNRIAEECPAPGPDCPFDYGHISRKHPFHCTLAGDPLRHTSTAIAPGSGQT